MRDNKEKGDKKNEYELDKWDVILSNMVVISLVMAIIIVGISSL